MKALGPATAALVLVGLFSLTAITVNSSLAHALQWGPDPIGEPSGVR